ncbi:uncharacterized protein LOC132538211 [Erinaceus europaeus]|uniref:Uncharacterized protein LOC132538211 n=1 Tax=Erinaceus europaeus TaxID=9365 RepID=A0ABM3XDB2_ERIEU|nr:uncharacterized protein LOC132538211 [Erinaceus europaeus]
MVNRVFSKTLGNEVHKTSQAMLLATGFNTVSLPKPHPVKERVSTKLASKEPIEGTQENQKRYPSAELGLASGGEAGSKVSSAVIGWSSPAPPYPRGAALWRARAALLIVCNLPRDEQQTLFVLSHVREVAPFGDWRDWTRTGRGMQIELRPGAGPVSPRVWQTPAWPENRGPGRRRRGREAAASEPDQCRIASCVADRPPGSRCHQDAGQASLD